MWPPNRDFVEPADEIRFKKKDLVGDRDIAQVGCLP